jgi:quercetin dioxygenase-like cupin family protein
MARPGNVMLNRATGQRLTFRRTASQTRGRVLEVEIAYPPFGDAPAEHLHPEQEATLEILDGSVRVRLDGRQVDVSAGDVLVIAAGAHHSAWNAGSTHARGVWLTYPALNTEALLETLWALGHAQRTDRRGAPGVLYTALLLREHRRELRLVQPSPVVQRLLVGILAPLAFVLGYARRLRYVDL